MLSNAYFLAKFRFDTAENEPAKNLQKLQIFPIFPILRRGPEHEQSSRKRGRGPGVVRGRSASFVDALDPDAATDVSSHLRATYRGN